MQLDREPARQDTLRKLRVYLGLLMNFEAPLQSTGFDLSEAYRFALREYDRIAALGAAAHQNAQRKPEWEEACQDTERLLYEQLDDTLEHLRLYAPTHALLPEYLSYRARLRQCLSSLRSPGSDPSPVADPHRAPDKDLLMGIAFSRVQDFYARLAVAPPAHEFASLFLVFLAGVFVAQNPRRKSALPVETEPPANLLVSLSRLLLKEAVDFALQSDPQALVRASVRMEDQRAFHCLFMGLAFVQQNPPAQVNDWLRGGREMDKRLRLYFIMGLLAVEDASARRLIKPLQGRIPALVGEHFAQTHVALLESCFGSRSISNRG